MRTSAAKVDCPVPPPSRQTTYARALHRACLILGGVPQVASHLGVSESTLRNWLEGRDDPPQMVFLAAVEIVLLHLEQPGTSN
jgi:transcriptional regulator with XRE-family HTH domain